MIVAEISGKQMEVCVEREACADMGQVIFEETRVQET
jgi:hypothetical protein